MNITQSILQIYPTLKFGIDFEVEDKSDGNGSVLTWITENPTEPTAQELTDAWVLVQAKQVKDANIEAFRKCDGIITQLKAKKVELDDVFANDGCSVGNKTEITNAISKLTARITTEETNRNALIDQGVIDHGVGIGNDYGDEIVNHIVGNI